MTEELKERQIIALLSEKYEIIGQSSKIKNAMLKLYQAAPTDLSVLITGETGTGKEVFAKALHDLSLRKKYPFISVNCGAIPETLLESELFGHEKGAFTGATDQRKGFFESANHGTIFLDEIGEMPVGTQVKLLRILESGEFSRLGSSTIHKVDVRVVAATNRNLEDEVIKGNFRQDLFFRLKNVHIILPPLREHIEDIPILIDHFAKKYSDKLGIKYEGISTEALNILKSLPWVGNIRELKNMIETLITLEKTSYISTNIIKKYIPAALPAPKFEPVQNRESLIRITGYDEGSRELELIFRSLLELKNEVNDIKRFLHSLGLHIEEMKNEIQDTIHLSQKYEIENQDNFTTLNLAELEKKAIIEALKKNNGNRRKAAQELGISERTLYRKISDYNIL